MNTISMKNSYLNPSQSKEEINSSLLKKYGEIAGGMESQFVNYLLTEMRKSVAKDDNSSDENYYQGLLDSEYSKLVSETKEGLGLKKMILNQILPQNLKEIYQLGGTNEQQHTK